MKKIALIILAITTLSVTALAQRTAKGESFIRAEYSYPFDYGQGAGLSYGMYTLGGFWEGGVNWALRYYSIEEEAIGVNNHYTARGGYMVRLASTRNRVMSLYAGGGLLLGCGTYTTDKDGWYIISEIADKSLSGTQSYFLYGVYPKIEAEVFFAPTVAFSFCARAPLTFHTNSYSVFQRLTGWIRCELSAGIKVNF